MRYQCLVTLLILCLMPSISPASEQSKATTVFEQLKTLVGDWRSTDKNSATTVSYKLMAKGTTLVETWTMSPTLQSMTVYTMDGDRLLATHYCPQGNAPRLELVQSDKSGVHHFLFIDGANLQNPEGSHEHAFWIRLDSAKVITRNETYIANGAKYDPDKDKGSDESFVRIE